MQAYQGSKGTGYMNDTVLSSHSGEVITAVYTPTWFSMLAQQM